MTEKLDGNDHHIYPVINGKVYPLWSQFIEKKDRWIGGKLSDCGDSMDKNMGAGKQETEITDVTLKPNGKESAYFTIVGKDFSCGFDVRIGGISGKPGTRGVTFSGYADHEFWIEEPEKEDKNENE